MKPVSSLLRVGRPSRGRVALRGALALLPALALLAACADDEAPAAAVVDGTEISEQSVVDELEAIAANADYLDTLEQGGRDVLGEEDGTFSTAFASEVLARQIQYTIVTNEVARRGLEVDDECRAAARDEVVRGLANFSPAGDGQAIFEAFPESYRDQLVTWNAGVLVLQGDLADQPCINEAAIQDYFEEHQADFTQVCAHHILVGTAEEAAAIESELAAGADFAALATERSTDTGSGAQGGDLGCAAAGGYVPAFRDAVLEQDIGVVGPPVQSEFGYHVIVVDSREEAGLEDVRDQVVTAMAQDVQAGFGEWFNNALAAAEVSVDSRYGTWDATNAQINRPVADAGDETTTTDGSGTGSGSDSTPTTTDSTDG